MTLIVKDGQLVEATFAEVPQELLSEAASAIRAHLKYNLPRLNKLAASYGHPAFTEKATADDVTKVRRAIEEGIGWVTENERGKPVLVWGLSFEEGRVFADYILGLMHLQAIQGGGLKKYDSAVVSLHDYFHQNGFEFAVKLESWAKTPNELARWKGRG